ncbi:MAG: cytidylate kinase-like family protein [Chloroflexi bacterium]|nr:cytidylate kinase-like family protein [Chloroflexota bacterium]
MDADLNVVAQMCAVTISREYGSGGGEIAHRLADRIGWQLVDHEIVVHIARELNISEEEAEAHDEYVESITSRILTSMQGIYPAMFTTAPIPPMTTDPESYHEALSRVVEAAVAAGHVVIVGRGSQVLLAKRRDVLHVRVVASLNKRIAYVMQREGLDQDSARSRIHLKDQDRIRYLQTQYHLQPDDSHLYDLIVNTSVLGLENAIDLICLALQQKAKLLSTPSGELGPAAGLARYPGLPGDIRPPESMTEASS